MLQLASNWPKHKLRVKTQKLCRRTRVAITCLSKKFSWIFLHVLFYTSSSLQEICCKKGDRKLSFLLVRQKNLEHLIQHYLFHYCHCPQKGLDHKLEAQTQKLRRITHFAISCHSKNFSWQKSFVRNDFLYTQVSPEFGSKLDWWLKQRGSFFDFLTHKGKDLHHFVPLKSSGGAGRNSREQTRSSLLFVNRCWRQRLVNGVQYCHLS